MYIGADYYPEHWPRTRWETDAKLMQKAGFNVTRLAEFAWAFLEPEEGRFEFDWLDDALAVLAKHGVSAVLCTPTAVMPAWCARKYPETLAMKPDRTRIVWGVRKNNCFTSGTYRLLSERVTRAMAEHFRDAPNVIGWQTDNEFGHPVCHCPTCRSDFQDWLRNRYGSLDELNARWGTHFWGHVYGTWGEIEIPADFASYNPSLCLDWQRYFSWLNVRFQRDQVRILREVCPEHVVTHNLMGHFSDLNYYDLSEDLDFVSWDNYPVWGAPGIPYDASSAADVMRGLKRKNFWIMEQTAGPGGWGAFNRNPRPGEIRKIAYQQLAHGADGQVWFRWRTCTAGREQYWHGLLGHDGKPLRRYREAAQTAGEYHALAKELAGTTVRTPVAMLYDYDSNWALRIQPGYPGNDYQAARARFYNALFRAGVNVDMLPPSGPIEDYRVVIAPDLHVLPDALAQRLDAFVRNGGILVTDCRTGVKDETNLCHDRTLPGLLRDALGIEIEEYEVPGMEFAVTGTDGLPGQFTAHQYIDWVKAKTARTLAGYEQWHLAKFAAATVNEYGQGAGYYVGTVVKEPAFYDALIADVLARAKVRPLVTPPEGVEVSVRESAPDRCSAMLDGGSARTAKAAGQQAKAKRKLLFLINHTEDPKAVQVPAGKKELLTGKTTGDEWTLERYGVAVIKL